MIKKLICTCLILGMISCGRDKNSMGIAGLAPTDVYLNMEKQGFTASKTLGTKLGNFWDCKLTTDGIDYQVNIYSSDNSVVENIKATATES